MTNNYEEINYDDDDELDETSNNYFHHKKDNNNNDYHKGKRIKNKKYLHHHYCSSSNSNSNNSKTDLIELSVLNEKYHSDHLVIPIKPLSHAKIAWEEGNDGEGKVGKTTHWKFWLIVLFLTLKLIDEIY
ncbi:11269_t:CDS:2 [Diversispora eburnea]|uniref:11269_t:CDS:1 n=1 Tax=Diversispora eburnea TaxID=1213867 RepID=A0A9N8W035_9GLOM|nr:11269_t:CDS:2 [Diversispora eburnea]